MHEFSTLDGFADITECVAEMIKYAANEPSVGLYYVQQHARNAVPNAVRLGNEVVEKSREASLHAEDSKDSIATVRSMKECGFPIADEMIRDIEKALVVVSSKQPTRSGLPMERASSWGPTGSGYFSSVLKSAKKKASNFKWPPLDSAGFTQTKDDEKLVFHPDRLSSAASGASTSSSLRDVEADELPLSSRTTDEQPRGKLEDESSGSPFHGLAPEGESYDKFKADKEAKLEEWLEREREIS